MKPPSPTALLATLALAWLSLAATPRSAMAGPAIGAVAATASSMQVPETAPGYSIAMPAPATAALVLLPLAMRVARSRPGPTPRRGGAR